MNSERLKQQFEFIREIDKEKMIGRQTYVPMLMTKQGKRPSDRGNYGPQSGYTVFCRLISGTNSAVCGMNSKKGKHRKPDLPVPWTTFSRLC